MKEMYVDGWAWEIQDLHGNWVLCRWVAETRKELREETPPSPEARPVKVRLQRRQK